MMNMNMRSESIKSDRLDKSSNSSRKNKKKSGKKVNPIIDNWCVNNEEEEDEVNVVNNNHVGGMDYGQMFWQQPSGIPPHMQQHTGQRLFTAMSDPSVCGYSAVPMAYTMEPVSMPPIYPLYRPVPQPPTYNRSFRGKPRKNILRNHQIILANQGQTNIANGYSSLQENRSNYLTPKFYENGDYASLPPNANNNDTGDEGEELNSEHRRYSDPGLGPADIKSCENSDDSDSGESESSIITIGKNNKLVLSLVEQMTSLREANSRMFKELHETKLSLDSVKAELSRLKNQTSSDYQPGMFSDIISEMREASRALDESMTTKVTAIVENKNRQRQLELQEIKEHLAKITEEKFHDSRRIIKLEEEVTRLKLNSNNEDREIAAFEEETLALRRELQEARSRKLADNNNGIKCVEETINDRITPVIFEPPCVTSTPIRNIIKRDHKSLSHESNDSSASSLSSEPSSSSSSSSSPRPILSSSNSSRIVQENNYADIVDPDWEWKDLEHGSVKSNISIEEFHDDEEENTNNYCDKKSIKSLEPDEKERKALERLIQFHFKREQKLANIDNKKIITINKNNNIKNDNKNKKEAKKQAERSCFSITSSAASSTTTTTSSSSSSSESDVEKITELHTNNNNNNNGLLKMRRKRGIIDVPDVIVVAGKTVVSNELLSTRILTSRVLTAPSRATYTTAYI